MLFTMIWQLANGEKSEFKPVKLRLEIDLVPYPACGKWFYVNAYF